MVAIVCALGGNLEALSAARADYANFVTRTPSCFKTRQQRLFAFRSQRPRPQSLKCGRLLSQAVREHHHTPHEGLCVTTDDISRELTVPPPLFCGVLVTPPVPLATGEDDERPQ